MSALCSITNETISHLLSDIHYYHLVSVQLLSETDVQAEVEATIDLVHSSTSIEVTSIIKFLKLIYRSSYLVSALGTNAIVHRSSNETYFFAQTYPFGVDRHDTISCGESNSVGPAFFMSTANDHYEDKDKFQFELVAYDHFDRNTSATIQGFSGGCFPYDALLASTLQCLYDVQCLNILPDYFPRFKQVCVEFSPSVTSTPLF